MKAVNYTYTFNNFNFFVSLITNCLIICIFYLANNQGFDFHDFININVLVFGVHLNVWQ